MTAGEKPRYLNWHELVQPPKKSEPPPRRSAHYDAMAALPTPESLAVTVFPETYRGGRSPRPSAVYTKDLHLRLGVAWADRRERLHPQRVTKRNALRRAKAERARLSTERAA